MRKSEAGRSDQRREHLGAAAGEARLELTRRRPGGIVNSHVEVGGLCATCQRDQEASKDQNHP